MPKLIEDRLPQAAIYEQLAEECTELGKAALKKARILRGENPTPVTVEEADASVKEEYTDVVQCAMMLDIQCNWAQMEAKEERWNERLDIRDKKKLETGRRKLNLQFHSYGEYVSAETLESTIYLRFVSANAKDTSKYVLSLTPIPDVKRCVTNCVGVFKRNDKVMDVSVDFINELMAMIICNNPDTRISHILKYLNVVNK